MCLTPFLLLPILGERVWSNIILIHKRTFIKRESQNSCSGNGHDWKIILYFHTDVSYVVVSVWYSLFDEVSISPYTKPVYSYLTYCMHMTMFLMIHCECRPEAVKVKQLIKGWVQRRNLMYVLTSHSHTWIWDRLQQTKCRFAYLWRCICVCGKAHTHTQGGVKSMTQVRWNSDCQ